MIKTAALAAAGAIGLASAATAIPAQAAPLPLVHASYGCGPGWHPNGWGRCVPNAYYGYWGGPRWGHPYYRGFYGHWGHRAWGHGHWGHRR